MQFVRFRVDFAPGCSLGPGKIALLEAIAARRSLTQAAASLGMSYRYAWLLVEDMNGSFKERVTAATVGGAAGGGAVLTDFGTEVVRRYRAAQKRIDALAHDELESLSRKALVRDAGRVSPVTARRRSIKRVTGMPRARNRVRPT